MGPIADFPAIYRFCRFRKRNASGLLWLEVADGNPRERRNEVMENDTGQSIRMMHGINTTNVGLNGLFFDWFLVAYMNGSYSNNY